MCCGYSTIGDEKSGRQRSYNKTLSHFTEWPRGYPRTVPALSRVPKDPRAQALLAGRGGRPVSSNCWFCGEVITNPQFFITERLLDYGHFEGRTQRTAIHKSCYGKTQDEGIEVYFIHGLEVVTQEAI